MTKYKIEAKIFVKISQNSLIYYKTNIESSFVIGSCRNVMSETNLQFPSPNFSIVPHLSVVIVYYFQIAKIWNCPLSCCQYWSVPLSAHFTGDRRKHLHSAAPVWPHEIF